MTLKMKVTVLLLIVLLAFAGIAVASAATISLPEMAASFEGIDLAASDGGIVTMGECASATTCTGT